ncbi:phage GP46 family protein [uncultured Martelella sp.]|uniref:phage GP46 family protein n=1 Tax=uncultured Martelella sp. TaxID=392331 RepID=UPI0029C7C850|nr:phage GP46 family protein [uncultured Martelella sp.]
MRIIPIDDSGAEIWRAPDLVWNGVTADLAINALTHPTAPGDFTAEQALATQVLIALMTDRRVEESELPPGEMNRGWIGDSYDIGEHETPIGSRLWLLRRKALTEGIEYLAEAYAKEALQPLIDQEAVASITVSATANRTENRLELDIALYARSGQSVFAERYAIIWDQVKALS